MIHELYLKKYEGEKEGESYTMKRPNSREKTKMRPWIFTWQIKGVVSFAWLASAPRRSKHSTIVLLFWSHALLSITLFNSSSTANFAKHLQQRLRNYKEYKCQLEPAKCINFSLWVKRHTFRSFCSTMPEDNWWNITESNE